MPVTILITCSNETHFHDLGFRDMEVYFFDKKFCMIISKSEKGLINNRLCGIIRVI